MQAGRIARGLAQVYRQSAVPKDLVYKTAKKSMRTGAKIIENVGENIAQEKFNQHFRGKAEGPISMALSGTTDAGLKQLKTFGSDFKEIKPSCSTNHMAIFIHME